MAKQAESAVYRQLTDLFRTYGYEGTTLSLISEATGLVKASLYHRFPEGKQQMAGKVLDQSDQEFVGHVLEPLSHTGDPRDRIAEVGRRLMRFYGAGKLSCLLDTLTLAGDSPVVREHARRSMEAWIGAFQRVSQESGRTKEAARRRAEDAVAALEGALIVARVSGNRKPFHRAVESLPERLVCT